MGTNFKGKEITCFDELRYFTSVEKIGPGAFSGCSLLCKISLPTSCHSIGESAFSNCAKLTDLLIDDDGITEIGDCAFEYCVSWHPTILNLHHWIGPSDRPFSGVSMGVLYAPSVILSLPSSYYSNYMYHRGMFGGNRTSRASYALLYLRDIQVLYPGTFCQSNISCLVVNNSTPPEWRNTNNVLTAEEWANDKMQVFAGCEVCYIYVPDDSLSDYKEDTCWSTMAEKLLPLSQIRKVATRTIWDSLSPEEQLCTLIEEYM